jgi:hypothetical protein
VSANPNNITIMPQQGRSLTAANVREHVNLIQEVMQAVMKKDTHFGVIPGCKQPSLWKAGSEVLLTTFRIAVSLQVEDLSTPDCIRYRVHAIGTHQASGVIVGEGIGECSSDEGKYKWRRCYIKQEFDSTPETRRRIKYAQSQNKTVYENMEVRVDPADVANTVLKMAKKRAQIDLTLTATAASDIFTQDLEDIPEELRDTGEHEHRHDARTASPQPASTPERDKLVADLYAKADEGLEALTKTWAGLTEESRKLVGAEFGAIKRKAVAKDAAQ